MHNVIVYGTLRPNKGETFTIPGRMYSIGWFPGVTLDDPGESTVTCEMITVDDDQLLKLDRYEGYREDDPAGSLYLRQRYTLADGKDGWIYTFNRELPGKFTSVSDGDWLAFKNKKEAV